MIRGAAGRRRLTALLLALLVTVVGGCTRPHAKSVGFGPSDVAAMEVYIYPYGAEGAAAKHKEFRDKRVIAEWVRYFDYLPLEGAELSPDMLIGQEVAGFRFHLHDGSTFEISQVFLGMELLIVEADGSRGLTEHGSPFADQLTGATLVDVSEAPKVQTK